MISCAFSFSGPADTIHVPALEVLRRLHRVPLEYRDIPVDIKSRQLESAYFLTCWYHGNAPGSDDYVYKERLLAGSLLHHWCVSMGIMEATHCP